MTSNEQPHIRRETRIYPMCCTSANCGHGTCPADCRCLPVLHEFKAWVERKAAKVEDHIWCPLVYTATR